MNAMPSMPLFQYLQAMKYPLPEPIYHGVCHDNLPTQNPVTALDIVCRTGGYMNYGMYSNPALDKLIDEIRVEFDGEAQRLLIKEAALIWYHDAPQIILLPRKTLLVAVGKELLR